MCKVRLRGLVGEAEGMGNRTGLAAAGQVGRVRLGFRQTQAVWACVRAILVLVGFGSGSLRPREMGFGV